MSHEPGRQASRLTVSTEISQEFGYLVRLVNYLNPDVIVRLHHQILSFHRFGTESPSLHVTSWQLNELAGSVWTHTVFLSFSASLIVMDRTQAGSPVELQSIDPGEVPAEVRERPQVEFESYPEGGFAAWTVVLGSWCAMTAGLGLVNSVGVLEAYISTQLLPTESTNSTGWIFGIYVFVSYFCGVQVGPIFDARGPRELIVVGSIFLLVGTFTLGLCTGTSKSRWIKYPMLILRIHADRLPRRSCRILPIHFSIFNP